MQYLKSYLELLISLMFLFMGSFFWMQGFFFLMNNMAMVIYFPLLSSLNCSMGCMINLDWISLIFSGTVSWVASGVFFFSHFYMSQEKFKSRFTLILLSFVVSMYMLILGGDLFMILIGWDLLGITSYLLVAYFQSLKSYNASLMTALTNRIGDVAIILLIAFLLNKNSWSIFIFNKQISETLEHLSYILIVLASFTKSAQVPFSAWLPAAMAAPTPVSALVHSSTLVTAGVYLLIRFHYMLYMMKFMSLLTYGGGMTLIMASATALVETDIKKIVALSTLSQLGLMVMMLGMNQMYVAFFHLNTHAFFKSLLFIGTGDYIHNIFSFQDVRKSESMYIWSKALSAVILIANLGLTGMPFLSGFYSKDLFLEFSFIYHQSLFNVLFLYLTLALTIAYSIRFLFMGLFTQVKLSSLSLRSDLMFFQWIYTIVLFSLTLSGGSVLSWLICPCENFVVLSKMVKMNTLLVFLSSIFIFMKMNPQFYNFLSYHVLFSLFYLPQIKGEVPPYILMKIAPTFTINMEKIFLRKEIWITAPMKVQSLSIDSFKKKYSFLFMSSLIFILMMIF